MVCTTGFLLGVISTVITLVVVAPLLIKWLMKRQTSVLMDDIGKKVAAFTGNQTELNITEEETNGI